MLPAPKIIYGFRPLTRASSRSPCSSAVLQFILEKEVIKNSIERAIYKGGVYTGIAIVKRAPTLPCTRTAELHDPSTLHSGQTKVRPLHQQDQLKGGAALIPAKPSERQARISQPAADSSEPPAPARKPPPRPRSPPPSAHAPPPSPAARGDTACPADPGRE